MPFEVILRVFICYILPIFEYGLVLWITGKFSISAEQLINSTFTKFMKRYLNVPMSTQNSIIYHITNSLPLMTLLQQLVHKRLAIYLPECMESIQLTFFNNLPKEEDICNVQTFSHVPSHFWRSRVIWRIPANQKFRKSLCREVCDSYHYELCNSDVFHSTFSNSCVCKQCGQHLHAYHIPYNFCNVT